MTTLSLDLYAHLSQDAVVGRDTGGAVTVWNAAAERMYGHGASHALGQRLDPLLLTRYPVSRAEVDAVLERGEVWSGELRQTHRSGRELIVESRQVLHRDAAKNVTTIIEVNRDVTDVRASQTALERSEERYRALIEATDQYVWTNSPEGEMTGEQPGWARLTGQTPAQYHGYGWADRLHPDDREPAVAAWQDSVRRRSLYEMEQRVCVQGGSYRTFLVRAVPLLDPDGGLREWVGLHTDVTALKQAEQTVKAWGSELERQVAAQTHELRTANEELAAFAYTVSHDLRTPVRHVGSFAGLLRRKLGDHPDVLKYVDQIDHAANRMEVMTDALLGLARTGTMPLQLSEVDLEDLVAATRQEFEPELGHRTITWQIAALPTVRADRDLLRQVLVNLIGNAVKYTAGQAGATIEVWADERPAEVLVSVRDNGAGFDPQFAHKLFGVFQRLHHQHEFEGVGVGLANVKRIVEKHGGRVWAAGQPGGGATFTFSLLRE